MSTDLQISKCLEQREIDRRNWEQQSDESYEKVADTIATSIADSVFKKLGEHLKDPYNNLPTPSEPLSVPVYLDLKQSKNVTVLKELAKETAELPPYKEWFSTFGEKPKDVEVKEEEVSFSRKDRDDLGKDFSYFRNEMARVGQRLEEKVISLLADFQKKPENHKFGFKVEWYRKAERTFSNPSSFTDNVLKVDTWIGKETTPASEAPQAKASYFSFLRYFLNK